MLFHSSHQNDSVFDWMLKPHLLGLLKVNKNIVSLNVDEDKDILA
jgi:hypothetical protein